MSFGERPIEQNIKSHLFIYLMFISIIIVAVILNIIITKPYHSMDSILIKEDKCKQINVNSTLHYNVTGVLDCTSP